MRTADEEFKKFSVSFNNSSGLLFKTSDQSPHAHFITVHHNFNLPPKAGESIFSPSIVELTGQGPIDLCNYKSQCIYSSIEHDLVVILIRNHPFRSLSVLDVYTGYFPKSVVFGYPRGKAKTNFKMKFFNAGQRISATEKETDFSYEVGTSDTLFTGQHDDIQSVKGMSGGAVVILGNDDNYHLAGIIKKSAAYGGFEYTDISSLLTQINNGSPPESQLQLFENQAFIECNIDRESLDLNLIKKSILSSSGKIFKNYGSFNSSIEFINSKNQEINKMFTEIRSKQKELSNYYVFSGITHHENKEFAKSTIAFKKAIELHSSNEHIFNEAHGQRRKEKVISKRALEECKDSLKDIPNEDVDSEKLKEQRLLAIRKLEGIFEYHKSHDLRDEDYINAMSEIEKKELIQHCKQYSTLGGISFDLERPYFLSNLFIYFDMTGDAKEQCEKVIEIFNELPNEEKKEKVIYALKSRFLIAAKINPPPDRSDLRECFYIARHTPSVSQGFTHVIGCILELVDTLFKNQYEEGYIDEDTLNDFYAHFEFILAPLPEGHSLKNAVQLSYIEKQTLLTDKYSQYSKHDLISEINALKREHNKSQPRVFESKWVEPEASRTSFIDIINNIKKKIKRWLPLQRSTREP